MHLLVHAVNSCAAELLLLFPKFEVGIANTIFSFKWRKIFILMRKIHFQYEINGLASTKNCYFKFNDICIVLKHARNYIYPANTTRWPNAGLMLAHRLRLWANISPALRHVSCLQGMGSSSIRVNTICLLSATTVYTTAHTTKRPAPVQPQKSKFW